MTAAPKFATYEDLLAVSDHLVAQLVDGELLVQSRPASPHAQAVSTLGEELGPPFKRGRGGPGGWVILYEPELHLGTSPTQILVPDLAGWRRTTMPEMPHAAFFTQPPDWVCEALSPSTARFDRGRKLEIYAEAQVSHVWLVDPLERTLQVLALTTHMGKPRYVNETFYADDATVTAAPFEALMWQLGVLWLR
jgi:Uma2 family endonuclease